MYLLWFVAGSDPTRIEFGLPSAMVRGRFSAYIACILLTAMGLVSLPERVPPPGRGPLPVVAQFEDHPSTPSPNLVIGL